MSGLSINKIVLIGGGGHCKSVLDSLYSNGRRFNAVITDASIAPGTMVCGIEVVGTDDILPELLKDGYTDAVISVGSLENTTVRRNIYCNSDELGFSYPFIIDSSANVSGMANLKKGVFVGKKAVINSNCIIDEFAIINTGAIVEHDCKVGKFSHISIGTVLCGGCAVGDDVFVGANSTVIQGVTIGNNSIIGAGSLVLADVPPNSTVKGIWSR